MVIPTFEMDLKEKRRKKEKANNKKTQNKQKNTHQSVKRMDCVSHECKIREITFCVNLLKNINKTPRCYLCIDDLCFRTE